MKHPEKGSKWYCIDPAWNGYRQIFIYDHSVGDVLHGNKYSFPKLNIVSGWTMRYSEFSRCFVRIKEQGVCHYSCCEIRK